MSVHEHEASLRPDRSDFSRLAWAFGISLALHLFCYGGYEVGKKFGVWDAISNWAHRTKMLAALLHEAKKNPAILQQPQEAPLVFVDVNPAAATTEAPKDAKFYASQNSKASNPDAEADSNIPKITGEQTHVAKTEDSARSKAQPLQPSAQPAPEEHQAEQAKPKPQPGQLTMAKPDVTLRPETGAAEHTRPRTITEAKMRQPQSSQLAGQKMKQEGGVRRHLAITSLDAKATPFGAYDAAFIQAVQQRWYDLLDSRQFALDRTGRVVLQFRLNYDGRVTDMKCVESTVGDTLAYVCQKAILDPAPYEKWPGDMRRMLGDTRDVQFTFYY